MNPTKEALMKRIVPILTAVMLCLALCACSMLTGNPGPSSEDPGTQTAAPEPTKEVSAPTPETTAEPEPTQEASSAPASSSGDYMFTFLDVDWLTDPSVMRQQCEGNRYTGDFEWMLGTGVPMFSRFYQFDPQKNTLKCDWSSDTQYNSVLMEGRLDPPYGTKFFGVDVDKIPPLYISADAEADMQLISVTAVMKSTNDVSAQFAALKTAITEEYGMDPQIDQPNFALWSDPNSDDPSAVTLFSNGITNDVVYGLLTALDILQEMYPDL